MPKSSRRQEIFEVMKELGSEKEKEASILQNNPGILLPKKEIPPKAPEGERKAKEIKELASRLDVGAEKGKKAPELSPQEIENNLRKEYNYLISITRRSKKEQEGFEVVRRSLKKIEEDKKAKEKELSKLLSELPDLYSESKKNVDEFAKSFLDSKAEPEPKAVPEAPGAEVPPPPEAPPEVPAPPQETPAEQPRLARESKKRKIGRIAGILGLGVVGGVGYLALETLKTGWNVVKEIAGSIWEEVAKATGAGDIWERFKKTFWKFWGKKETK
ncbi:MAG: hypothetical protein AAB340_02960 [Patescibacteria group bacterium]